MKFCSACGSAGTYRIPEGDNRERFVCSKCGQIHYENPRIVVGHLAIHGDDVLLCKRDISPRFGKWTLPGGFLENAESSLEGANRETLEEACAQALKPKLYRLIELPHISQVHIYYRCELSDGRHSPGVETSETQFFSEAQIPWDELAFPTVSTVLKDYFIDRASGLFPTKILALRYQDSSPRFVRDDYGD